VRFHQNAIKKKTAVLHPGTRQERQILFVSCMKNFAIL